MQLHPSFIAVKRVLAGRLPFFSYRGLVLFMALLLTGIAIYNKISTYDIANRSSREQLQSRGAMIWVTLAGSLHGPVLDPAFFSMVAARHAGEVAYLALYDAFGKVVMHSDPRLLGTVNRATASDENRPPGPWADMQRQADGTMLYVLDMEISPEGMRHGPLLLRVSLHPHASLAILRDAKRTIIMSVAVIVFLWLLAWLFSNFSRKIDTLRQENLRQEHLATLGEMAAVMAHEIRSPLSSIKGFAQYLAEKYAGDQTHDEGCRVIVAESNRLEKLTDELLGYARADKISLEQFSLPELVETTWSHLASGEQAVTLRTSYGLPGDHIVSDREKLRQIVLNIFRNGIEAMPEGGAIEFEAHEGHDSLVLTVGDAGEGMDEATRDKALKPFFTTKVKGTGLGLAVVDRNVRLLHGAVTIDSTLGAGTRVTVHLPRNDHGTHQV
jgi:two-component system sensor histidine kinase HydH